MTRFVFVFRASTGPTDASFEEQSATWSNWFESHDPGRGEPRIVDPGLPVFERTSVGDVGPETALGGYCMVEADHLEQAVELAKTCPALEFGGGVELGILTELPPEHGARRLREKLAAER